VDAKVGVYRVGDLQAELVHDFFEGFAIGARANVHVKVLYGRFNHHKIEAIFKAFAKSVKMAMKKEGNQLPSTKGVL
jgi:imidazoleglycerol-phosphate dehydratase